MVRAGCGLQRHHEPVDDASPEVQSAELLAALLALGLVTGPTAEAVPMSAAWWIVEGHDGVEVVRLAGLSGEEADDVRDALQDALDAIGIERPSTASAITVVFDDLAQRCLAGRAIERSIVRDVERIYIETGYLDAVLDQPLGTTYGFDDEWVGGWGRTDAEIIAAVRTACEEQVWSGDDAT